MSEPEKAPVDFRIACRDSSRLLPAPMGKCGFWLSMGRNINLRSFGEWGAGVEVIVHRPSPSCAPWSCLSFKLWPRFVSDGASASIRARPQPIGCGL
jgi:hypothetical protein